MKKTYLLCLLLLLTLNPLSKASHLYGGDLRYEYISGNTYRIIVVLYGDCGSSQPQTFATLMFSTPEVYIRDAANPGAPIILNLPIDSAQSDIDVTPVCPADSNNTSCKSGILPGIKKFVYYDTVTIPYASTSWDITFTGLLWVDPGTQQTLGAGRTFSLTNVVTGAGYPSTMYLVATLNNTNGPNSSPEYTTVPTPFYCINVAQQYNQGASDPDGDSLSFKLVPGLHNGAPVNYISPYTAQQPLHANPFSFNPVNGQMSFKPDLIQRSLVVNEVREYKNGVLVGSSMREMSFIVLDNCSNTPPNGDLATNGSGISGGVFEGGNTINVCKGSGEISFNLSPTDDNPGDNITLTAYNVPQGANLTIQNNDSPDPQVNFSWNISNVATGVYTFYINYKDNGCPLSTNQTLAYTIRIVSNYSILTEILSETQCHHRAAVRYTLSNGVLPRTITVMQGNTVINTIFDSTGIVIDSLAAGNYTIRVSSPYFSCDTSIDITVQNSGPYPEAPVSEQTISACVGETGGILNANPAIGGTLNWYDAEGNLLNATPTYSAGVAGVYTWYVSQTVNVCTSDTVAVLVRVHDLPQAEILNKAGKVCYADKIYLRAGGGVQYEWLPAYAVQKDEQGEPYAFVTEPISYQVICTDINGCKDTADLAFAEIEKCCGFGYPNAFTPNNDGKNDRFRPVLYGNMEEFEIFVYNRFGEVVYHSTDPLAGWDGSYKGQLCDVGMYYFQVKAKCYTGQTEHHSDAVDLLR